MTRTTWHPWWTNPDDARKALNRYAGMCIGLANLVPMIHAAHTGKRDFPMGEETTCSNEACKYAIKLLNPDEYEEE